MGSRIVGRLHGRAGELLLWDRTRSRALEIASRLPGSRVAQELRDLGSADVVFVMVRDSPATLSVVSGLPKAGKLIVNLATILPSDSLRIKSMVESEGGRFVDAPVVGSTPAAEEGKLVVLASGDEGAVRELEPLLSLIGRPLYVGQVPSGAHAKLAANLLLAGLTEVLAEALEFADRVGLDRGVLANVISASPYNNAYFNLKLVRMMSGDFSAQFPLDLMHKDLKYIVSVAQEAGAFIPLTSLAEQIFGRAESAGCARKDLSAIYELLRSCCSGSAAGS
ncbi:MAG: NAD(P)-dependent oxidoreductase [Conexivisphaera sp.]